MKQKQEGEGRCGKQDQSVLSLSCAGSQGKGLRVYPASHFSSGPGMRVQDAEETRSSRWQRGTCQPEPSSPALRE